MTRAPKSRQPLADLVWPAHRFVQRDLPPRPWMVEGCIPAPSIGMLYAWRGAGKTLTAVDLALCIARGTPWLSYQVPTPRAVLYVDGEMPIADLRMRLEAQAGLLGPPANLFILASEDLAVAHRNLNLAQAEDRDELARAIVALDKEYGVKIELVILDNWTTLVRGLDENESAELDDLKDWCKLLRHGERSLLFIHHAGKGGAQRGSSAREDILDYSIKLSGEDGPELFEWDKMRTGRVTPDSFAMRLVKEEGTKYMHLARVVHVSLPKGPEPKHDDRVLAFLLEAGASRHGEVAEALELDKKIITRALSRLVKAQKVSVLADGKYCHA